MGNTRHTRLYISGETQQICFPWLNIAIWFWIEKTTKQKQKQKQRTKQNKKQTINCNAPKLCRKKAEADS